MGECGGDMLRDDREEDGSARKMMALPMMMETKTMIGKDRISHASCIK
jgi:hypothetical protein